MHAMLKVLHRVSTDVLCNGLHHSHVDQPLCRVEVTAAVLLVKAAFMDLTPLTYIDSCTQLRLCSVSL